MNVVAHPHGRHAVRLDVVGEPTYTESVPGGYDYAQFEAVLADRDNLLLAPVYIWGSEGMVWAGHITEIGEGEVASIRCSGWGNCLARTRRSIIYSDTRIGDFRDYEGTDGETFFRTTTSDKLKMGQQAGSSLNAGASGGFYYWNENDTIQEITFDARVAHADVKLQIYSSDTEGAASTLVYTKTAVSTETGQSATIGGKQGFVVRCYVEVSPSEPSKSDKFVRISNLTMYGTSDTSVTVSDVVGDCLDQLSTDFLPAGDEYRSHVKTEPTVLEPFEFSGRRGGTDRDKILEALGYTTYEYGWWAERTSTGVRPLPHLFPKPSDPEYVVNLANVDADLVGDDAAPLASDVRVHYSTRDGRSAYVDRSDTDTSHYLPRYGLTKYAEIDADTTSTALAGTIGSNFLALAGEFQVNGTIEVDSAVVTLDGARVLPSAIRAGQRIRLLGHARGAVDVRITHVEKRGQHHAKLTLSNKPRQLDVELARLTKNQTAR